MSEASYENANLDAYPKNEDGDTLIAFEHKFFNTMEKPYFRMSAQQDTPVFVFKMSEDEYVLPFDGIKREFHLDKDSPDAIMLDLIAEGLNFVKALEIGGPLPKEVLTGEASWEVEERHRQVAYQRVTLQLVAWLTGDEFKVTSTKELAQIAENPETKEKVNQAISETAKKMGLGDDKEGVLSLIATLANELSHIEALREKFAYIKIMDKKIDGLRKVYANEISILEIAEAVGRLNKIAVKEYQEQFDEIDAHTGEILSVLQNLAAQVKFIHKSRDNLFKRLNAWDEMFRLWEQTYAKRSKFNENLLHKTYRFLAQRYLPADDWVLFTQLSQHQGTGKMKTAMVW